MKRRLFLKAMGAGLFLGSVSRELHHPVLGSTGASGPDTISQNASQLQSEDPFRHGRLVKLAEPTTEAEARQDLKHYAQQYSTLEEWNERAHLIKQGLLDGAKIPTQMKKNALNPMFRNKREYGSYMVSNVAFESLPGIFVAGNLYEPVEKTSQNPGVICPHGHFEGGRFREEQQIRSAMFAQMGAVVFSYDMVGWGEANQIDHGEARVLSLQIWNSIRAVDFLLSLGYVDERNIGCTGASGGGSQTIYLSALDERVRASVPVVMVSAHDPGHCNCEISMPIRYRDTHTTNNVEIAALTAPRPQLLISCGSDHTHNTPDVEYPYIRSVYRLYGKEALVENLHLSEENHNYGYSKRVGAYQFFAKHLGLSIEQVTTKNGDITEENVVVEDPEDMRVFPANSSMPGHALQSKEAVKYLIDFFG